jgi:hypothetical protein
VAETADRWNAKGLAFMGAGDLEKALDCYGKAVKAETTYAP